MLVLLGAMDEDSKRAAHFLLSQGLRKYFGLDEMPETAHGPMGKPWFPSCPHISFNLSHSGAYALCALSDGPVGVDIEAVRPRPLRLPAYVLTEEEYRWYQGHGGGWGAFYTLWTRKESWCKYAGESAARPKTICPPLPGERAGALVVHSFSGDGWRAALCTAEQEKLDILWNPVTKPRAGTIS